jgi:hypothetical protein
VSKQTIKQHEGKKYLKRIHSPAERDENDRPAVIHVDVYAVLEAFDVQCPAIAHCIKKLLMPGQRGKGNIQADLKGAMAALNRAIELQDVREGSPREHSQVVKLPTTTDSAMPTDPEALKERLAEVTGKTPETLGKVASAAGISKAEEKFIDTVKSMMDDDKTMELGTVVIPAHPGPRPLDPAKYPPAPEIGE